ncbi:MAG: MMPL family transporter [Thermoanaerobaculia bacterium]|nr:MMPL family transporter [Thermoanaerobaculia bacterium]
MTPRRPLERLILFAGRRHRLVFLIFFLVVAGSAALSFRLRFDPDVLHLLPTRNPNVITFRETLEQFGNVDYFVVGIRIPEDAPLDPYEALADDLAGRMTASTEFFRAVESKLGEPEELLREFLPKAILFLDAPARERLAEKLTGPEVRNRAKELRRTLEMPQAVALKDLLKLDPLGISGIFLDRLGGQRGPLAVDWTSGRYLSRDHRLLLVLGKPTHNPQDIDFNRRLYESMQASVAAASAGWSDLAEGSEAPVPEVFFGGRYMIALDDTGLIRRDVILNAATSIVGVLVLFYIAYRRTSLLLLVFWPLACGLAITFGFAALAVGVLSSATAGVAALLVGLGDDFVIVLYGRYVEERQKGASVADSMRSMGGSTARGVVLGAITTAATFYAFLITDFTGLYQMGLIVGTGVLFCLLAVLFLVPAMIGWSEAHHSKRDSEPRLHIFAFGIEHLTRLATRMPRATLSAAALMTIAAIATAPYLRFDDNVEALRPPGNRGILAQTEINSHFGAGFDSMSLVLKAQTLPEVLALADKAAVAGRRLVADGQLGGVDAVTAVLPPPTIQQEALDWLADERAGRLDMVRIRSEFATALAGEGLRIEPFAAGLDLLAKTLSPEGLLTREGVLAVPQGRSLLDRYLKETPEGWTSVVKLYNLPGRPKREIPEAAVDLAASLGPQATLTGMNVLSRSLRGEIRADALASGLIGLALTLFLLWVDFRDVHTAFIALVPLLVGIVWMVALMVAFDLHLNFMNIFVITMIIGIGVDYGIHVIHRYREEDRTPGGDPAAAVEETSRGVFLAALTTIVGFGSLATSHYPGLISMGLVSTIGTLTTALVAIAVIPAYLTLRGRKHRGPEKPVRLR